MSCIVAGSDIVRASDGCSYYGLDKLSNAGDVNISSISDGDVLRWNIAGSCWVGSDPSSDIEVSVLSNGPSFYERFIVCSNMLYKYSQINTMGSSCCICILDINKSDNDILINRYSCSCSDHVEINSTSVIGDNRIASITNIQSGRSCNTDIKHEYRTEQLNYGQGNSCSSQYICSYVPNGCLAQIFIEADTHNNSSGCSNTILASYGLNGSATFGVFYDRVCANSFLGSGICVKKNYTRLQGGSTSTYLNISECNSCIHSSRKTVVSSFHRCDSSCDYGLFLCGVGNVSDCNIQGKVYTRGGVLMLGCSSSPSSVFSVEDIESADSTTYVKTSSNYVHIHSPSNIIIEGNSAICQNATSCISSCVSDQYSHYSKTISPGHSYTEISGDGGITNCLIMCGQNVCLNSTTNSCGSIRFLERLNICTIDTEDSICTEQYHTVCNTDNNTSNVYSERKFYSADHISCTSYTNNASMSICSAKNVSSDSAGIYSSSELCGKTSVQSCKAMKLVDYTSSQCGIAKRCSINCNSSFLSTCIVGKSSCIYNYNTISTYGYVENGTIIYGPDDKTTLTIKSTTPNDSGVIMLCSNELYSNSCRIRLTGIPTSDPHVPDQVWNDGGILKISAG